MDDQKLLKISLITSVAGICCLFFIFELTDYNTYHVSDIIAGNNTEEEFYIIGRVNRVSETNKTIIIDLVEQKEIRQRVLYFKDTEKISLKKGDSVKMLVSLFDDGLIASNILLNP